MTETRLFEHVPETNTTRLFHYDPETDTARIETVQDVSGLIGDNKSLFAGVDERARWHDGQGDRVASIPLNVFFDLQQKGIVDDQAAFRRWLNAPENRFFRTRPGKI